MPVLARLGRRGSIGSDAADADRAWPSGSDSVCRRLPTVYHRLPGARLRAAGAEGGGRSRPAGASSRGRSSIMRPDRLSDHDDDDRGAESGPGRRPPDLDLPIFDPEDAEAEREAGAFPDVEDEEDDEAELDDE